MELVIALLLVSVGERLYGLTNKAKRLNLRRGDERSQESGNKRQSGRQCRRGPMLSAELRADVLINIINEKP